MVHGRRAPMVGRMSSDATTVDVTDVDVTDHGSVSPADEFVLLGAQGRARITADELAAARNTISWEVLQTLGARLPRIYVADGRPIAVRPTGSIGVVSAAIEVREPYG